MLSHHNTFPQMFRERLFHILSEEYTLSPEQKLHIEVAMIQNLDDKRLPESTLHTIEQRELTRLRRYSENNCKETAYLQKPSMVGMPEEKGKPCEYLKKIPHPPRRLHQSHYY